MCSTSVWPCTLAWENKQTAGREVEVLGNKPSVFRIFETLAHAAAVARWFAQSARSEKILGSNLCFYIQLSQQKALSTQPLLHLTGVVFFCHDI